jgi:hypothetical protein
MSKSGRAGISDVIWETLKQRLVEGLGSSSQDSDVFRAHRVGFVYRKVLDKMREMENAKETDRWQKLHDFCMHEGMDPQADVIALPADSERWLEISLLMSKVERDDSD